MPDLAMCASTVCPVRKNCARNWDSRQHVPDRDPKQQVWVGNLATHDVFCLYYVRVQPHYVPEYVSYGRSMEIEQVMLKDVRFALRGENYRSAMNHVSLLHKGEAGSWDLRQQSVDLIGNYRVRADGTITLESVKIRQL